MNLSERILKLMQDTNMVTSNPLLDAINFPFIQQMETLAATDEGASRILAQMSQIIEGLNIQDIEGCKRLYGKYGEAKLYLWLKNRRGVQTEVLSEHGHDQRGGPDFRIEYEEREFFAEVKSPVMLGGNLKYIKIMEDSLNNKIDVVEQAKQKGIGIGFQVIEPHQKDHRIYNVHKVKLVTENLIDKFLQNYKPAQYAMGHTISLVYLHPHNFPLFSCGNPANKILAIYFNKALNYPVSGELWSAAFGRKGMMVFCPPEFEGKPNIEGTLNKDGIFHSCSEVKAMCFYVDSVGQDSDDLTGLVHSKADLSIRNLITYLTTIYNDEGNAQTWRLLCI